MNRAFGLVLVPVAALALTACGGGDKASGSMPGHSMSMSAAPAASAAHQHNDHDVMFAQGMIPHHEQAVAMAKLAASRASMPEVKELATTIEGAQDPEIKQMKGWLTTWGASMPSSDMHMGHDMGGGMMSAEEMKKLEGLSGKQFDKAFLTMMIKHHQGALTMAQAEQANGMSAEAKKLAGNIVTSQSAEIAKMQSLLKKM
jgi:uncharacterized protein (DUF305 family)